MGGPKTREILRSIAESCLGSALANDASLVDWASEPDQQLKLTAALREELGVEVSVEEMRSRCSFPELSDLVESRLAHDVKGRSLVDIYVAVEQFVREELPHDVNYHWHAAWLGDVLHDTDSLEDVEIVIRMEEAFGFSIPDREAQQMYTVGKTVRYLWQRIAEQNFILRHSPKDVCHSSFIFYELRRLVMMHGGVLRTEVRLDARLGELLPTWSFQFWQKLPSIFGVDLPHGNFLSRSFGIEKRTSVRELVGLLASSKS